MNTLARIAVLAALAALTACGMPEHHGDKMKPWTGGLFAVWEPSGDNAQWACARAPNDPTPCATIILHQGHSRFDDPDFDLTRVATAFAAKGFHVYGMEMPGTEHDKLTLSDFVSPVYQLLDTTGPAYIVGLSGGGWTASVVSAYDTRVLKAYSVAGDMPYDVRPANSFGDAEHQLIDYRQLYALAGNRLLHIYNYMDTCCFSSVDFPTLDLGYDYVIDYSSYWHQISPWAVDYIINDIQTLIAVQP